ncbi:MAG: aspartate aminotransferase [Deltaproteobacteria bacterium]|nr:MAG: aspartate aminotransferase [Deltaproteobacteria bacterium]
MKLSQKAMSIKPSATLAITAKANQMRAEGIDVISFGAGEPDFDTPEHIKKAAISAIEAGFTKYTPVGGIEELKEAIVAKLKRENKVEYDISEVLVSSGGKHSYYNVAQAMFDPGDEVIIPTPYWVSYPPIIKLAGATPVIIETSEEDGFKLSPDELKKVITKSTRALILNSPSNPSGTAYTKEELEEIANIALENNIYILSDEIYEKIIYDGFQQVSIASLSKEIKDKTIILNGVSKTYAMTGWRIGYTAGPKELISAMNRIQSQSTSNPSSISQKAALAALNSPQDDVYKMVEAFKERRDYIVKKLNSIPGIKCFNPIGAFYVFPNISNYFSKKFNGKTIKNSYDFTNYLLEKAKVAVVPGIEFGKEGYIRLSYATSLEKIKEGLNRLEEAVLSLA